MTKTASLLAMLAVMTMAAAGEAAAASKYGCFRVTTDELNIRDRPYSTASVIGTAKKGEIVEKRKLWCTLRGYWCAIRTADGLEGYGDKTFMDKIACR